ncbi:hydroxyisourate hydrolase [Neobacillus cucumis]|jgi:5-hydroxyisourate hydrolase|uniref:hydroxyisourate hydrolase n=1 Tax=Neobacillus cucumis TaxID=1740721 RepID=UPI001965B42B|nr:hydroxyisourate hydrolase [Neobacillus cucumis]MED4228381.1 hydroxyisourate hydrolase [Neobacillus cucumis]
MSGLTTHILDLTHGLPASNVTIELYSVSNAGRYLLKTTVTNADGRLDQPLLSGEETKVGTYELVFHIGDYFRSKNLTLPDPLFLDIVPVRFGISNIESHYHVPLLVSPYGYQIYRGS